MHQTTRVGTHVHWRCGIWLDALGRERVETGVRGREGESPGGGKGRERTPLGMGP